VDHELAQSPEAKLRLLKTIAGLYLDLGLDDQAVDLSRKRLALCRSIQGKRSPAVAEALVDLAGAMHSSQSAGQEESVLHEAEALLDSLRDFTSPTRALLDSKLGEFYFSSDLPRAVKYAHQAVLAYGAQPPSSELVEALYTEGLLRSEQSDFGESERLTSDAAIISKRLEGDPNPALPRIYATLGQAQEASMEFEAAEQSLRHALSAARGVNGDDHVDTVQTTMRLGMFLGNTSRPREALELLTTARNTVLKIRGPDDSFHTPQVLLEYGWALARIGRIEEGLESIMAAVKNRRKNRPGTRFLAAMLEYQARVLIETGDYAGAASALDEASAILDKMHDTADWRCADYRARLFLTVGRIEDAAPLVKAAEALAGASNIRSLRARALQVEWSRARGDSAGLVSNASAIRQEVAGSPSRPYLKEWEAMASLAEGQGYVSLRQPAKALPLLSRASELFSSMLDPASAVLADVQAALAECWLQLGDRAKAKSLLSEAQRIAATHPHLGVQHLRPLIEVDKGLRSYGSH
jgi:serine/threonine-protein kinase